MRKTNGQTDRSAPGWHRLGWALTLVGGVAGAQAADAPRIDITIKDHRFEPAEIHVPSGQAAVLFVKNADDTAEEFESSALKVEKVIAAGASATIRLRPLGKGRFPFMGEFHSDTAVGVVVAE